MIRTILLATLLGGALAAQEEATVRAILVRTAELGHEIGAREDASEWALYFPEEGILGYVSTTRRGHPVRIVAGELIIGDACEIRRGPVVRMVTLDVEGDRVRVPRSFLRALRLHLALEAEILGDFDDLVR